MIAFLDLKNEQFLADCEIKLTDGVNGEKSITGTIYHGDYVKKNIDKGWSLDFQGEEYAVLTYSRNDGDNTIDFTAVHMFFYRLKTLSFYEEWNGSHSAIEYLNVIFAGTGYSYQLETQIPAFEKQNWGMTDKLSLFNDFIKQTGTEFYVSGSTAHIVTQRGENLATLVRQGFNLSEASLETDNSSFATYGKGFGKWNDEENHNAGRLTVEYYSPLYEIYRQKFGKIEAAPVVDERYTIAANLLAAVKEKVDNSFSMALTIKLLDLQNAGYPYAMARAGDFIQVVDESLDFSREVRIVKVTSNYDINGQRTDVDVTAGDLTLAQKAAIGQAELAGTVNDLVSGEVWQTLSGIANGDALLPEEWFDEKMRQAADSIQNVTTELEFTEKGIIARDKNDHNKVVVLNSAGLGISLDGGNTFKTAITATEINGQVINIKNLNAGNIVAGVIRGKNLEINLDTGAVQFTAGYIQGTTKGGILRLDMDQASLESVDERNAGFLTTEGKMIFYSDFWGQTRREFGRIEPSILAEDENALKISGTNGVSIGSTTGSTSSPDFKSARIAIGSDLFSDKGDIQAQATGKIKMISGGNTFLMKDDDINIGILGVGKSSLVAKELIISTAFNGQTGIYSGHRLILSGPQEIQMTGDTSIFGDLGITGNKNAITPTRDGIRATPAYEMAESYFGDMGETKTGDDCRVNVPIDVIFGDIVNTNYKYQVFLQSYSAAHVWVAERHDEYFIIESDKPNAPVAWELKARRRGHETERLVKQDNVDYAVFDEKRDPLAELKQQEDSNNDN